MVPTNKTRAQSDPGINVELFTEETSFKCQLENSPVITIKNAYQSFGHTYKTQFTGRAIQTLTVYERNGGMHHTIYYNKENKLAKEASFNTKIIENDLTTQFPTDFLFSMLVTRPATWYLSRMSVVLK